MSSDMTKPHAQDKPKKKHQTNVASKSAHGAFIYGIMLRRDFIKFMVPNQN